MQKRPRQRKRLKKRNMWEEQGAAKAFNMKEQK